MKREMAEVVLYDDGTYELHDIESCYRTQKFYGFRNGKPANIYYCPKDRWREYLIKLLDTKEIDQEIKKLNQKKKRIEKLKIKIEKEISKE